MTKTGIIRETAARAHVTQEAARQIIDTALDVTREALADREKVIIGGVGTFTTVEAAGRRFRPSVRFHAVDALRDYLDGEA